MPEHTIHLSFLIHVHFQWPSDLCWSCYLVQVTFLCMAVIHRHHSGNCPWWLSDIQEVLHLRNGCNSLSVTLTYPPSFCRSSNNHVQGDLFHVNGLLLRDDRGKGRAGIYQRGKPLPRKEHQIQLGTEAVALVPGCVWRGQTLASAPVIHQESKAQPLCNLYWSTSLILMTYFSLISSKKTSTRPTREWNSNNFL